MEHPDKKGLFYWMLMDPVVRLTPVCIYIERIFNKELAGVTKKHFPEDILLD